MRQQSDEHGARAGEQAGRGWPGLGGVAGPGIAAAVIAAGFLGLDRWFYEQVALRLNTPSPMDADFYHRTLPIWDAIRFYPHIVGGAIVYSLIWMVRRSGLRRANAALAVVLACAVAAHLLQEVVGRSRPNQASSALAFVAPLSGLWAHQPCGFPSGEASTAFALSFVLRREFRRAGLLVYVPAVLACLARALFGMHYISDVVAGGAFALWFTPWVMRGALGIQRGWGGRRRCGS